MVERHLTYFTTGAGVCNPDFHAFKSFHIKDSATRGHMFANEWFSCNHLGKPLLIGHAGTQHEKKERCRDFISEKHPFDPDPVIVTCTTGQIDLLPYVLRYNPSSSVTSGWRGLAPVHWSE